MASGSFWTVDPAGTDATKRYELRWGGRDFWIDLKQELTRGEQRRIDAAGVRSWSKRADASANTEVALLDSLEMNVNVELATFEKMRVWLAGWSLTRDDGTPLPRTVEVIRSLRNGVGELIELTIDNHAAEVNDLRKKVEIVEETSVESRLKRISSS